MAVKWMLMFHECIPHSCVAYQPLGYGFDRCSYKCLEAVPGRCRNRFSRRAVHQGGLQRALGLRGRQSQEVQWRGYQGIQRVYSREGSGIVEIDSLFHCLINHFSGQPFPLEGDGDARSFCKKLSDVDPLLGKTAPVLAPL